MEGSGGAAEPGLDPLHDPQARWVIDRKLAIQSQQGLTFHTKHIFSKAFTYVSSLLMIGYEKIHQEFLLFWHPLSYII
jgi:hypothetical protein